MSSAGALVDTLRELDARRIALIAPYLPDLTRRVCDYVAAEGVDVAAARSLAVADNGAVGRLDPRGLLDARRAAAARRRRRRALRLRADAVPCR